MELSEKDLENVMGGIPSELVDDKNLEHPELYRDKQLETLRQEKEILEKMKEQKEVNFEENQIPHI